MRLIDLHEKVIDFAAARAARNKTPSNEISVDFDLDKLGYREEADKDNLALLMDHLKEVQATLKIPSFGSLQEIMRYLTTVGAPQNPELAAEWLASLPDDEQSKVKMISHHANRIEKMINKMIFELMKFKSSLAKTSKVQEVVDKNAAAFAVYLQTVNALSAF